MKIPSSFTNQIAEAFYDKDIDRYTKVSVNDYGHITYTFTKGTSFKGNCQFSNLGQVREDYGITEDIDIVITTQAVVALNDVVGYGTRKYRVIQSIPNDSHNLVMGVKWVQ